MEESESDRGITLSFLTHTLFFPRLDYFQRDIYRVINCNIGSLDLSDHTPRSMDLILGSEKKSTIWRLDTGILNQMRQQIRMDAKDYLDENDNGEVSPPVLWDDYKEVLRGKVIGYSSNLKNQQKEKLDRLQIEFKKLEDTHKKTLNQRTKIEIDRKKNKLNEIYSNETKKADLSKTKIL